MSTRTKRVATTGIRLARSWFTQVAGDREDYPTASLYEGALLGVLAAWELLVTRDRTSTLWHKLWRYECAIAKLPTLSGVGVSDQEPQLPALVLAALDPIMHEAVPTRQSADAQSLAEYLAHFQIPHADMPPEHVEGFCVEFVCVYQRLRGMEPEHLTAWRLWRTILSDSNRPALTLTQSISGRPPAPGKSHIYSRVRIALIAMAATLEPALTQM